MKPDAKLIKMIQSYIMTGAIAYVRATHSLIYFSSVSFSDSFKENDSSSLLVF